LWPWLQKAFGAGGGSHVGTVSDPTGAVIAQAKVTAISRRYKSFPVHLTSNAGTFVIPSLAVGAIQYGSNRPVCDEEYFGGHSDVSQQRNLGFQTRYSGNN